MQSGFNEDEGFLEYRGGYRRRFERISRRMYEKGLLGFDEMTGITEILVLIERMNLTLWRTPLFKVDNNIPLTFVDQMILNRTAQQLDLDRYCFNAKV